MAWMRKEILEFEKPSPSNRSNALKSWDNGSVSLKGSLEWIELKLQHDSAIV